MHVCIIMYLITILKIPATVPRIKSEFCANPIPMIILREHLERCQEMKYIKLHVYMYMYSKLHIHVYVKPCNIYFTMSHFCMYSVSQHKEQDEIIISVEKPWENVYKLYQNNSILYSYYFDAV